MIYFENLQLTICLVLFFIIGKFLFIYTLVQPVSSIRIPPIRIAFLLFPIKLIPQ
jgi:hypothetical protein